MTIAYKILLITFCLPLLHATVFAQREKLDSLRRILPDTKDSSRVECLNNICEQYLDVRVDSAYLYALQALDEARKINYKHGIATAYYNLSNTAGAFGTNFPLAEKYSSLALSTFKELNDTKGYCRSVMLLAHDLWAQSKFDLAIKRFNELIQLTRQMNDKKLEQETYVWIGGVQDQRGDYAKSVESLRSILEIEKEKTFSDSYRYALAGDIYNSIGDYENALKNIRLGKQGPHCDGMYLISMGSTFYHLKQYDSAVSYYENVRGYSSARIAPNDSVTENDIQRWSNSRMGEVFLALNKYHDAEQYFTGALLAFEKAHDLNQVMWVLFRLGKTYVSKNSYEKALETSHKLLRIATETGARQYVRDAHYLLYKVFSQLQNDIAYDHLEQYLTLKEILDQELASKNIYFLEASIELNRAQSRIDLLNSEKKIHQQEIAIAGEQKKYIFIGSALMVLIAVGFLRNIILKRKNEKQLRRIAEAELENQRYEAAKTKAELLQQATELEMQALRAQMNPHFIFNSLNSINRFILKSNKEDASQYLTKFSKLVRSILQNSMVSSVDLEREIESLQLYLELEALRFNHRFNFTINVAPSVDITIVKVPPLLIQPFAENAIWHGLMQKDELGHLDISISEKDGHLILQITDDGVGRQKAEEMKSKSATRHKSLGLKITEERIAMLGSSLKNESSITINDLVHPDGSAAGTDVIIKIPLLYA